MSKDFPTIEEMDAYDRGFAHAEDYWRPKEREVLINWLSERICADHAIKGCEHAVCYELADTIIALLKDVI
jgi:uncharacterized tellurite resistance protein B-like protein